MERVGSSTISAAGKGRRSNPLGNYDITQRYSQSTELRKVDVGCQSRRFA